MAKKAQTRPNAARIRRQIEEKREALTPETVRGLLAYDRERGELRWRKSSRRAQAGVVAGVIHMGYRRIMIGGRHYPAHWLVWLLERHEWPASQLDHINGNKSDNRIENLRLATASQNAANKKSPNTNTSGLKGASWFSETGRWRAGIIVRGKSIHLGFYDSAEEAHAAYCLAARDAFGEFARAA